MKKFQITFVMLVALTLGIWACSGDDKGGGGGKDNCSASSCSCESLCTDAGFDSGEESIFADGDVVECLCEGTEGGVTKSSCETYCDQFDVTAENSFLTTENNPDDKCVCDGTS
ncbi:MAG: hypothetical protein IT286_01540 [Proteobacteria bacterium]|jgi:hypothetical protein|nr:hypothetical protein [Pseudomonadota bacterium]